VFYFALKFVVGPIPPITATAISRGTSIGPSGLALFLAGPVPRANARVLGRMALVAALDNLAFVSYSLGVAAVGSLAVLGTVSGLFSAVTVAWAMAFLGERLRPAQWAGVASIFLGVAVLAFLGGA
jgi:drug/metabolite transporter (DMT)-like permease